MSLENFIPNLWAGTILRALQTSLVYPQLMTRDYEGEIAGAGDTVKINMIGDPTISNYSKNTDLSTVETLTDAQLALKIDQAKSFNFQVDDIDKAQQNPKVMDEASARAGYGLRKVTDAYVASLYTDASATNQIGSDASPITGTWLATGTLAYDRLVDLGVLLDNNDVPDVGRFCVVPPWFEGYLLKDARFTSGATAGALANLLKGSLTGSDPEGIGESGSGYGKPEGPGNGWIGQAAGFDLYKSNQVPNTTATKYKIIAGHPQAWADGDQIVHAEGYRPEKRFGDALKGLHVYGAKVLRPYELAILTGNST